MPNTVMMEIIFMWDGWTVVAGGGSLKKIFARPNISIWIFQFSFARGCIAKLFQTPTLLPRNTRIR